MHWKTSTVMWVMRLEPATTTAGNRKQHGSANGPAICAGKEGMSAL